MRSVLAARHEKVATLIPLTTALAAPFRERTFRNAVSGAK
jgi:hypothetical protein